MLKRLIISLTRFLRREDGPTSVEYAVMLMLVVGAAVSAIQMFGGTQAGSLQDSTQKIGEATNGGS
jgi:Flp pilus assembly pilin Flp